MGDNEPVAWDFGKCLEEAPPKGRHVLCMMMGGPTIIAVCILDAWLRFLPRSEPTGLGIACIVISEVIVFATFIALGVLWMNYDEDRWRKRWGMPPRKSKLSARVAEGGATGS